MEGPPVDHRRRRSRDNAGPSGDIIIRTWGARVLPGWTDDYVRFFRRVVRPQLDALAGFEGAEILVLRDGAEIVVQTRWDSMEAIRLFAGEDPSRAVVEPEAIALFVDYDATVRHYEVVEG